MLDRISTILYWVKRNPAGGFFSVVGITFLVVILMLPDAFVAIGVGSAFNQCFDNKAVAITVGTFSIFIGCYLGGIVGFNLGRFVARD